MITKDGRDTPISELTAENYVVPHGEEKDYHAVIEVVQYDSRTGKKLSKPRVQKFGRKIFERNILSSLRKQGYTITILHDPTEWLKGQEAKRTESRKAKEALEQSRFQAAVDAAVEARLKDAIELALAEHDKSKKTKKSELQNY